MGEEGSGQRNVASLCRKVGMSRQNYYVKSPSRKRRETDEGLIIELVKEERRLQPRLGGRKVYNILSHKLKREGVRVGRDRFFEILRRNNLLIKRKKAFIPKTTNSRHILPVFSNLIQDREATSPNQIWASDLTYIRTQEGFIYGALTTDMWSRNIVGSNAGENLEAEGCLKALRQAMKQCPKNKYPIHHSDRGSQYCSHAYVKKLRKRGFSVSMTEENHCYENALAERVNGILKQEYGLGIEFKTKKQAIRAFNQAVYLYNNRRPHMSLGYKTPAQVHNQKAA